MTAEVEILVSELDNVLSVPVDAIVQYDDKYHVAVKKPDGVIEFREVELGMSNGHVVQVKKGIENGDVVVSKPLDLLTDKQKRQAGTLPTQPAARPRSK
jgi:multidrug efflux pump subunit AcrA (membrane-fusion protein)